MISVIVPVYKVEKYLDKCINSIATQTYRDLEIILVDDGSPDSCGFLCDEWKKRDNRILVIHKKNGGLSDARNVGIEASHGEYLSFIDSDDYIDPGMLEQLYHAITEHDAQIAVCNFTYEYADDYKAEENKILREKSLFEEKLLLTGKDFVERAMKDLATVSVVAWNKLYRRELFAKLKYPKGRLHEDEFVFHHLMYPCDRIVCIPYIGYHYLQRTSSIVNSEISLIRYIDVIDAYIDRGRYFLERNEKALTVRCDGLILSRLKKARQSYSRRQLLAQRKALFFLNCRMFSCGWVPFIVLCKRFVRCFFL